MDLDRIKAKIAKNMPKEAIPSLKWSKVSNYCLKSECGRFTVGKSQVNGQTFYGAWLGKTMLGVRLESGDAAKQLCESHARELGKEQPENTVPATLQKRSKAEMACK